MSDQSSLSDVVPKKHKRTKTEHQTRGKASNDPSVPYIIVRIISFYMRLGIESEFHLQAHSSIAQTRITTADVSYGVQFEMARLVSMNRLNYDDISSTVLATLKGTNAQAAPETARKFVEVGTSSDNLPDPAFAREAAAKVRIANLSQIPTN